jgi:hypothetical protein
VPTPAREKDLQKTALGSKPTSKKLMPGKKKDFSSIK